MTFFITWARTHVWFLFLHFDSSQLMMECSAGCRQGTILDLPHNLVCDSAMEVAVSQGLPVDSKPNPNYFNKGKLLAMAAAGGKGLFKDGAKGCLAGICGSV